jgi:calcium/calmodulin-dependent protein kinase I
LKKKKKVDKDTARHEDVRDYYEFGREIGRGGFSVVVEGAKKGTSERFAIKCIKKANVERDDIKLLRREIQIMKQVDHPNILKLFEVFESEEEFFLVMELVDGKVRLLFVCLFLCSICPQELFDKIVERGQYSEKDAANIVRQIISAVEYLHERGIAHRDLVRRISCFMMRVLIAFGRNLKTCCRAEPTRRK